MSTLTTLQPPNNWPEKANRAQWAKILGIRLAKLVYEEQCGRLEGRKEGFNTIYTKDDIWNWWTGR
jgi:hypothetical protein